MLVRPLPFFQGAFGEGKMRARRARFGVAPPKADWAKLTAERVTLLHDAEYREMETFEQTQAGARLIRVPVCAAVIYAHYDEAKRIDWLYVQRAVIPAFIPTDRGTERQYTRAAKRIIDGTNTLLDVVMRAR
jgi:hypothetical protein